MSLETVPHAPPDWERKTIGEIAEVNPSYPVESGKEYPFLEMAAVAENFGGVIEFARRNLDSSGLSKFRRDDILFGKITPCPENGKVALVEELPGEYGIGSTEFITLSPRPGNDPHFVYYLMCFNPVHGRAVSRMEGSTGRLRITEDTFTKWLTVAVPKLPEQRAIAAVLDAADAAIERTRAAVAAARRVKRGLVQQFFEAGLGRVSCADSPAAKPAKGWRLVQTGKVLLGEPKNGISPNTESGPPGFITFSIAAVRHGRVDLLNRDHWKYARISAAEADSYRLNRGDLLIVRGNANPDLVGKCGIVEEMPADCIYPDILKRVHFDTSANGVDPRFAEIAWNHAVVHNQILKRAKTSNGTLKVNTRDVKQIVMPVPPRDEQERLVATVRAAESLERSLTATLAAHERLKRGLMQVLLTGRVRVPVAPNESKP